MSNKLVQETRKWEELLTWRPRLEDILFVATCLQRRKAGFCANGVWHAVFEPLVEHEVGWNSRKPTCGVLHVYSLEQLENDEPEGGHTDECRGHWAEQEWLRTSDAYDLAFQTIYRALPNCQHPPMWGCI
jgi:hypothetical protein